jgi:hydrophobic/amphiphilic exporter-1 (mainly G- bacteria), HAE1 family
MRFGISLTLICALAAPAQTQIRRVGVSAAERKLSLRDALEMGLKSNLEIEIERSNTAAAVQSFRSAQGYFDPNIRWLPTIDSRATPTASVLQGAGGKLSEHQHSQNFYFRDKLPWAGTSLGMDFENSRQSTSNSFVSLTPYKMSRLTFSLTQPLVRNRKLDRERAEIRIRRKQIDISETDFELRVIDVLTRVETAYWDLVAAREDAQVKKDAVDWAREQLSRNRRMIASGMLAPVELAGSEAELERRLDTWYASVGTITDVENVLKSLLAGDRTESMWNEEVIPTESRRPEPKPMESLNALVTQAVEQRPELRQLSLRMDTNDVQKKLSADQTRPQVNLVASYSNSGLGGTLQTKENPITASTALMYDRLNQLSSLAGLPVLPSASFGTLPDYLIGGYGTALSNVFGGRYQSVQVGLSFDLTLRNRTAQANLSQTLIAEKRLKLERARAEQAIEAQVRGALQAMETARQRIRAAEASEKAAKEKLDSEIRLFQTGESTNFLVLTRQNEYADSSLRAVSAHLGFNKAVARLEQALGATLRSHEVKLK